MALRRLEWGRSPEVVVDSMGCAMLEQVIRGGKDDLP